MIRLRAEKAKKEAAQKAAKEKDEKGTGRKAAADEARKKELGPSRLSLKARLKEEHGRTTSSASGKGLKAGHGRTTPPSASARKKTTSRGERQTERHEMQGGRGRQEQDYPDRDDHDDRDRGRREERGDGMQEPPPKRSNTMQEPRWMCTPG